MVVIQKHVFSIIQEAVAICFETERQRLASPECYFNSISEELRPKRDKMTAFLPEVGVVPTVPDAGYFMVADFSNLRKSASVLCKKTVSYITIGLGLTFLQKKCQGKVISGICELARKKAF